MKFKPGNFRKLTEEPDSDTACPNIRTVGPLILIKHSGEASFDNTRGGKDEMVASFDESKDLLLWAWPGQWRTDVFQLSKVDLEKHYKGPTS